MLTQFVDLDTGETLGDQEIERDGIPFSQFDFSTKEGILAPFEDLEEIALETSHAAMCGATENFLKTVAASKKKQNRPDVMSR